MKATFPSLLLTAAACLGWTISTPLTGWAVDAEQTATITGTVYFENDPSTNAQGTVLQTVDRIRYSTRDILGLLSTNVIPVDATSGKLLLISREVTLEDFEDPVFVVRLGTNNFELPDGLFDLSSIGASASTLSLRTNGVFSYTASYVSEFNVVNDLTSPSLEILTSVFATERGASKTFQGELIGPPGSFSADGVGELTSDGDTGPTTIKVTVGGAKLIP
jgi:hypothetical protein